MSHEPPADLPPSRRTAPYDDPRRAWRAALAPVLASILAAATFLVMSRVIESATDGPDGDSIDLSRVAAILLGAGAAATAVWAVGLAVAVSALRPRGRRTGLWWLFAGAGTATLLLGMRLVPSVLPSGPVVQAWLLQQVVLALISVTADRRAVRDEPQPVLTS